MSPYTASSLVGQVKPYFFLLFLENEIVRCVYGGRVYRRYQGKCYVGWLSPWKNCQQVELGVIEIIE